MPKIKVHEKALAHLSRGLYRSPASALRELVSNAWDANATEVRINTNYPNFLLISIEDNGDGFNRQDFKDLMEGGIGNSTKRPPRPLINSRPIIGRLGIGMLGIAQICGGFKVISKPRNGQGFHARVKMYDLLKTTLDASNDVASEIDVGTYDFEAFDQNDFTFGTQIVADDVHPTFARSFQESRLFEHFKEPPLEWEAALGVVSRIRSLQELGDYWRLLWELATNSPIPYLRDDVLPHGLIAADQRHLIQFNFRVFVDGLQLFKPVLLSGNAGGYTAERIETQTLRVYGKEVRFHGYLVVQEGAQLKPDELRGILIRVRNVAIGYYDPSMLDYRFNEGPRSRWLTGEIVIDAGLEDALNIDRDSFNRFHPEFREVQARVHDILHERIFPESYRKIKTRSATRQRKIKAEHAAHFQEVARKEVGRPIIITENAYTSGPDLPRASLADQARRISLSVPKPEELPTKRANRELASAILGIYEISARERTNDARRKTFTRLLLELLKNW
jgi:Histidine kinase-, DNA gyrase B-, and HSP90-like ATPase